MPGLDTPLDQVKQVLVPQPGGEVSRLGRAWDACADAQAHRFDAMLVPVHARNSLPPQLGQAVETVRPQRAIQLQSRGLIGGIHADGVVGTGEDDATHTLTPSAFVHSYQAAQVVLDDLIERALDTGAAHVDQHIDARQQAINRHGVAQIGDTQVFAGHQRLQRLAGRRSQSDATAQPFLAQYAAKSTRRSSERDFAHGQILYLTHALIRSSDFGSNRFTAAGSIASQAVSPTLGACFGAKRRVTGLPPSRAVP